MKVGLILSMRTVQDISEGNVPVEDEKMITYVCARGDDQMIPTTERPHPLII